MRDITTEVGSAYVTLLPSLRGFRSKADRAISRDVTAIGTSAGRKFGQSFSTSTSRSIRSRFAAIGKVAAVGLAAGVGAAAVGLRGAIDSASDLGETTSKAAQIFGDEALPALRKFSEGAARALGQSEQSALDAAATFAVFGKSANLRGPDLVRFSTDLTRLASDMASFGNTSPEEAITAIGAALRGESEPIRRYGVLLDDATLRQEALALGLIKTTKEALTPQQKVLAAQAQIFKQTSDAQGDFTRTSGGLANQQRILRAQLENTRAEIGAKLLPTVTKIATWINERGIPALSRFGDRFQTEVVPRARTLVVFLRDRLIPRLRDLAERVLPLVVGAFQGFADALQRMVPPARKIVGFLREHEEIVVPLAASLGTYAAAVWAVTRATRAWAAAQLAVNSAMLTNPYIAAAAAVAGLAAGMVYLNQTTGRGHDVFVELGKIATRITVAIGRGLTYIIDKSLERLADFFHIAENVISVGGLFDTSLTRGFGRAGDAIDGARDRLADFDEDLRAMQDRVLSIGVTFYNAAPAGMSVRQLAEGIPATGTTPTPDRRADAKIAERLRDQFEAINKASAQIYDAGAGLGESLAAGIASKKDDAARKAKETAQAAVDAAKRVLRSARDELRSYAESVRDSISSFGSITGITQEDRDVTPSTVAGFLRHQLQAVAAFQRNLKTLARRGISDSLLRQIADAGVEDGGAIASALVKANASQFAQIQADDRRLQRKASSIGQLTANRVLGDEVGRARGKLAEVINITVNNPKPERAGESVQKSLRRTTFAAGLP